MHTSCDWQLHYLLTIPACDFTKRAENRKFLWVWSLWCNYWENALIFENPKPTSNVTHQVNPSNHFNTVHQRIQQNSNVHTSPGFQWHLKIFTIQTELDKLYKTHQYHNYFSSFGSDHGTQIKGVRKPNFEGTVMQTQCYLEHKQLTSRLAPQPMQPIYSCNQPRNKQTKSVQLHNYINSSVNTDIFRL